MRLRLVAGLISLVALATVVTAADEPKNKMPWEGFGVGSMVHTKTTVKMSVPGQPPMPENVSERRETLVKVTDEAWIVKSESKVGADWVVAGEHPHPRKLSADAEKLAGSLKGESEDLGTEKVTVEGKAYECKKIRTKADFGTSTTWTHETHGTLKMDSEQTVGSSMSMVVTALAKKVTVAGKEIVCREQKSVMKIKMGPITSENTMVTLTSDAVPGRAVRTEVAGTSGPMTTSSVIEVVAFEAK